jgi:hypothetical protein
MDMPTYPIKYSSEPGVTLLKAAKPAPVVKQEVPARQFPLAGQRQVHPLEGKV